MGWTAGGTDGELEGAAEEGAAEGGALLEDDGATDAELDGSTLVPAEGASTRSSTARPIRSASAARSGAASSSPPVPEHEPVEQDRRRTPPPTTTTKTADGRSRILTTASGRGRQPPGPEARLRGRGPSGRRPRLGRQSRPLGSAFLLVLLAFVGVVLVRLVGLLGLLGLVGASVASSAASPARRLRTRPVLRARSASAPAHHRRPWVPTPCRALRCSDASSVDPARRARPPPAAPSSAPRLGLIGLGHPVGSLQSRSGIGRAPGLRRSVPKAHPQASRSAGTSNPAMPGDRRRPPRTRQHRRYAERIDEKPARPIAMDSDANTSEKRIPTTRPIMSPGVRCWNSVWLGITKIMFATPSPIARPMRRRDVARSAPSPTMHAP